MQIDDECVAILVKWLEEGDPPPPKPPFDPETGLLPEAIRGKEAPRLIADALSKMAGHLDLALTLDQLAHDVYDVAGSKALRGDRRMDWMRRLSNATAKLAELAGGDFPPPSDDQISEAFAFAFSGRKIELVLRPGEDGSEDVPDGTGDAWEGVSYDDADAAAAAHASADSQIEFGES